MQQSNNENINFNITYNTDNNMYEDSLMEFAETRQGYIYPLESLYISAEEFEEFKDIILEEFKDTRIYDFGSGKNFFQKWVHENFSILLRGNTKERFIYTQTKSLETSQFIYDTYKKCSTQESSVKVFVTTYGEKNTSTKTMDTEELNDTSELYYPYIDTDAMFQQFFTGNENILILAGNPGLGKTRLVSLLLKYAYNNTEYLPYDKSDIETVECPFVSVGRVKSVNVLANDHFWESIQKAQHDFIILDDLDFMLTKRDAEVRSQDDVIRNSFLNHFLPFTDGIDANNTKFIITTNQPYDDIDTALLRKGRLFDILELRNLKLNEALNIWTDKGLKEADFSKLFSGEEVNAAELGSEIHKKLNKRVKNKVKSYLLEEGISKVQKAKRTKKIGL